MTHTGRSLAAVVGLSNLGQRLRVLGGATDVDLVLVHLDLESRGKEGVETHNQVRMALEQVGDSADNPRSVNANK